MVKIAKEPRRRKPRAKPSVSERSIAGPQAEFLTQNDNPLLQSIIDNLPGVIFRCVQVSDGSVNYPYIDPRLRSWCGKGATGKSRAKTLLHRYLHPDDRPLFMNAMALSAKELTPVEVDVRLDTVMNPTKWLRAVSYPRQLESGDIQWDGIALDVTTTKALETHLAYHDVLTGLPNRSFFVDWLNQVLGRSSGAQASMIIIALELISLADILESSGFDAGDASIRETGKRLQAAMRGGDMLAYTGAGSFLMALMRNAGEEDLAKPVRTIMSQFKARLEFGGQDFPLDILMGIILPLEDGSEAEALIDKATTALNQVKNEPEQIYRCYDAQMTERAILRLSIESDLRRAVQKNEFVLHYQPQYDTRTLTIVGVEALIRWRHPERGLVLPGEFITVAEETGLIVQLGEFALRQACTQAHNWQCRGIADIPISVNLSGFQLTEKDLGDRILGILSETGLPPHRLKLELTETTIVRDVKATMRTMKQLADAGIYFAVDDFGIEHSALSHLSRLPIEALKIDYSFVSQMTTDRVHAALVQAMIVMTHAMNMTAVAEGIENRQQLTYLQAYQCDSLQGFLFSKPLTAGKFEALAKRQRLKQVNKTTS